MQAVHRALYDLDPCTAIVAAAEADYRRSELEEKYDFWYYRKCWAVVRRKLAHGRAFKLVIAKELEDSIHSV